MGDLEVPDWLKSLPLAPEYRPTETEFADPIAFISRVEQEAAGFGICKVIPPLPKPSKRFVFANINRSLSRSPDLSPGARGSCGGGGDDGVFTTRHQELGSRRGKGSVHKQVWQSGEVYTLEQFEAKSKAFTRSRLGSGRDVSALSVESLFWKAVAEKPIYVEYANDVPGSGFSVPEALLWSNLSRSRRKRKLERGIRDFGSRSLDRSHEGVSDSPSIVSSPGKDMEGTSGWKLSNSPWNLQVIAKSPGSLTRFMPDEVPGVTSPMIYIGMLFSWFAWHVEDHELHSLNFLHTGSPKTWYAVPGAHASRLEDVAHMQGYGCDIDRLAAFIMLGEKRTLFSPEVLVASGIPCCRLVQNPGEFVVTFPKAYHVGFSHGFNCGEAANFATSKWLKVAKEAAVRRAAMSYLPMLSHQQLLYMLAVSFISRVPRAFLPGARSSRLKNRKKEEREDTVKRAFMDDMMGEHDLLLSLLGKESTLRAVYWDPDLLPSICDKVPLQPLSIISDEPVPLINKCSLEVVQSVNEDDESLNHNIKNELHAVAVGIEKDSIDEYVDDEHHHDQKVGRTNIYVDNDDLPCGLDVDAGTLACVACGILGYPFMSVIQPSDSVLKEPPAAAADISLHERTKIQKLSMAFFSSCRAESTSDDVCIPYPHSVTSDDRMNDHPMAIEACKIVENDNCAFMKEEPVMVSDGKHWVHGGKEVGISNSDIHNHFQGNSDVSPTEMHEVLGVDLVPSEGNPGGKWNTSDLSLRPRIFCLQHALEVQELLQCIGGCNVLVICHSDYLKIKAQAISVAEEIGVNFDNTDVPIEVASKADLDLINMSIDDEEYEENIEDWTSKLGLNLRNCVKLRKQPSVKQGKLSLALRGLFSDTVCLSVSSNLKWHPRKSRTHNRGSSLNKSRLLRGAADLETNKWSKDQEDIFEKVQMSTTHECESLYMAETTKRCSPLKELYPRTLNCVNESTMVDDKDDFDKDICSSGYTACEHSELRNETTELCLASTPEKSETCKVIHKESVGGGIALSSDLPITIKLGVENVVEDDGDMVDVSDSAKDLSSSMTVCPEILQDTLCTNAWPNDGVTNSLVETERKQNVVPVGTQDMVPDGTNAEESLINDSVNFTSSIIDSETAVENRTVAKEQDNSHTCNTDTEVNSGLHQETSSAMGSLIKSTKCNISESALKSDTVFLNSGVAGDHFAAGTSLKCYVRRKKATEKGILFSTIFDSLKCSPTAASPVSQDFETCNITPDTEKESEVKGSITSVVIGGAHSNLTDTNQSDKRRKKRRPEIDLLANEQFDSSGFVHSPCERLRARTGRNISMMHDNREGNVGTRDVLKRSTGAVSQNKKAKVDGAYQCGLEGCRMKFRTKEELALHKRNRCTYEGCGKRFSKHRYAMRHGRVHADERPLKCSWNGCNMSFKWAWARTEHLRVHTGERPYKCEVTGCGLTFRFVSDFSRHRRKSGHRVNPSST